MICCKRSKVAPRMRPNLGVVSAGQKVSGPFLSTKRVLTPFVPRPTGPAKASARRRPAPRRPPQRRAGKHQRDRRRTEEYWVTKSRGGFSWQFCPCSGAPQEEDAGRYSVDSDALLPLHSPRVSGGLYPRRPRSPGERPGPFLASPFDTFVILSPCVRPQSPIAVMTGRRLSPSSVAAYSTLGGTSA
jgi:hypothetical protein